MELLNTGLEAPKAQELNERTGVLYECSHCHRIMWRRPGESEYKIYRTE